MAGQDDLPIYRDRGAVPRDLRTAGELRGNGFPRLGEAVAWFEDVATAVREPLYSTSAARRLRGDRWNWARPTGEEASGQTAGNGASRPGGVRLGTRLEPRHVALRSSPKRLLSDMFREGFVVIDTETTGLGARDEIIEIAALDSGGALLFESTVWPHAERVPADATRIHGLRLEDLVGSPTWPTVLERLQAALSGRRILAWNAPFDERMVVQSSRAWRVVSDLPGFECAMRTYARHRGVGSGAMRLERAAQIEGVAGSAQSHRSADDARLTLAVLRRLAERAPNDA